MASCPHCGDHHPGGPLCPRTGEPMSEPGRCGTHVERYLIERLIGSGSFGSVYRARHIRTDAQVALKILRPDRASESVAVERFMREARTAVAVGDEHAVGVMDAEVLPDGTAFIAMELLEGEDLKTLTDRQRAVHPTRLVRLIAQVLDGLAAAHDKGIIHRDMKPANIFIIRKRDANGNEIEFAKLLDFGISKMESSANASPLTRVGSALGTPSYMAWEQFFDARLVDGRTDIYAIAVILYELLGGKKPFEADSLPQLMDKVRRGGVPPLRSLAPALPMQLCAAIEKALARKPERRWATAREFARALRDTIPLTGEPPEAADPERSVQTMIRPRAVELNSDKGDTVIQPRPVALDPAQTVIRPSAFEEADTVDKTGEPSA